MSNEVLIYYHWPAFWVGGYPPGYPLNIDLKTIGEEVHRETLPLGIEVKVLKEGMFFFNFANWLRGKPLPDMSSATDQNTALSLTHEFREAIRERIAVLNTHLLCLYSALSVKQRFVTRKMFLSSYDIIESDSLDNGGLGYEDPRLSHLLDSKRRATHVHGQDWRVTMRQLNIELDTLKESFRLLTNILQHPSDDILIVTELLARSCKDFEEYNFNLCLINAWTIIEYLLNRLWNRYIENHRQRTISGTVKTFINAERKQKLEDDRSFTASIITEILSLAGDLPLNTYKDIEVVRKKRNKWLHDLEPIEWESAKLSIKVAEDMLQLVENIDFNVLLRF